MKKKIIATTLAAIVMASTIQESQLAEAATYKLKNGVLMNSATGKVAAGYVLYKGRLYKNGKLNKGYVVYSGKLYRHSVLNTGYKIMGTGNKMRLYDNATLKKGNKTARAKTLLFKNGILAKGYVQTSTKERLYKDGFLAKGTTMYPQKDVATAKKLYLYQDGYLYKGLKRYRYLNQYTYLFNNGYLDTKDYRLHDDVLFHEGRKVLKKMLYQGNYYERGILATGYYKELFYIKGILANGMYNGDEYKDGKLQFTVDSIEAIDRTILRVKGKGLTGLRKDDVKVDGTASVGLSYPEDRVMEVDLEMPLPLNTPTTVRIGDQMFTVSYIADIQRFGLWEDTFAENEPVTLQFNIENTMQTVDMLKLQGYEVTFEADEAIFEEGTTSTTGKLRGGTGTSSVKITLKNADKTYEKTIPVTFTKLQATEEQEPYTLSVKHKEGYSAIQSNTLVIGEQGYISSAAFGGGPGRIDGFGLALTSSNPAVAAIEQKPVKEGRLPTDQIIAKKAGKTTITIATKGYKQEFELTVVNDERKLTTVDAPSKYEAVVGNANKEKIPVTLLDQYGDFMELETPIRVVYPAIVGMPDEGKLYNSYAPLEFNVKQSGQAGDILYKDDEGKILAKTTVTTEGLATKEHLVLDRKSEETRHHVQMSALTRFAFEDARGKYAGGATVADLKGYRIQYNPGMVMINGVSTGEYVFTGNEATPDVSIGGRHEGHTTLNFYNPQGEKVLTTTWYFYDDQPSIIQLTTHDIATVRAPTTLGFRDVLYTREEAGKDDIVEKITLSRDNDYPVRSASERRSWVGQYDEVDSPYVNYGDLYVDYDNDGQFSPSDERIADLTTEDEKNYATTGRIVTEKGQIKIKYGKIVSKVIDVE